MGGRTALSGRGLGVGWLGADACCEMRLLVMEAILCSGDTAAVPERSPPAWSGGRIELLSGDAVGAPRGQRRSNR